MKKFFFIFVAFIAFSASTYATSVYVKLTDGRTIRGEILSCSDSVLVVEPNTLVKYEKKLKTAEVNYFEIDGIGRFNSINGKFVPDATALENLNNPTSNEEVPTHTESIFKIKKVDPSSPNEVIGMALKTTGGVALGIGAPALAAGTILIAFGHAPSNFMSLETRERVQIAGHILMPIGASLTIISIPLLVHGKRIAEMEFNYTGTGAGLVLNF